MGVLVFLFSLECLLAIPPILDHLWPFKTAKPPYRGPSSEKVVSHEGEARAFYQYNEQGHLEKAIYYRDGKKEGESLFQYQKQKILSEILYDAQGKLIEKILYNYNDRDELTGCQVFNNSGEEVLKWKFTLQNGEIIFGERLIGREVTESFRFEKGTETKQVLFDGEGKKQGEILYRIENGIIKERLKTDFTGTRKVVYSYDSQNRLKQMTFYRQNKDTWEKVKEHEFFYE